MLQVSLFGKPTIHISMAAPAVQMSGSTQKLFCYLLLFRNQVHSRETLATLFWGDHSNKKSKKYLRQTLWQMGQILKQNLDKKTLDFLQVEPEWVQLKECAAFELDVALFEQVFETVSGIPGSQLDESGVAMVKEVITLYQGDLLSGWCDEWCLYERERLQHMYLAFLHKMIQHCEACGIYEEGIQYGMSVLRCDRAHERTHRQMMRLYHRSGDRTMALHQYEQCVHILHSELGVSPSPQTQALYQKICRGQLLQEYPKPRPFPSPASPPRQTDPDLLSLLQNMKQTQNTVRQLQRQLQAEIALVEHLIQQRRHTDA